MLKSRPQEHLSCPCEKLFPALARNFFLLLLFPLHVFANAIFFSFREGHLFEDLKAHMLKHWQSKRQTYLVNKMETH